MLTFADYMDRVLYGPAGYYSSGAAKSGKAGDYFTAPDVGPVFGQLLASIFQEWEKRLGLERFTIIEAGAGEGRLSQDILKAHPFRYAVIERSESRRKILESLPLKVDVSSGFDAGQSQTLEGVFFGNELIDAFPVHRVRMENGKLKELYVGPAPTFRWGPPSTPRLQSYFDRLGITLPEDYETEVNLAMADWFIAAGQAFGKGIVVLIDYGRPAHDYYDPERTRGTLRAFSKHKVSADFLDPKGMVDLTADVDFTSLALDAKAAGFAPLAFMEMGTFLMSAVSANGRMGGPAISFIENADAPTRRHATMSLRYLLHPEGLGTAFHVLVLGKNIDPKEWIFEHNRISRLGLPA